jgi:succinylglutamate desuccinylase
MRKRVIGRYEGQEKGPLLILFGAMHGNEQAGVKAIDLMMKMLEVEPITNPAFEYKGKVIGLVGNLAAFKQQRRFIDKDLNRCWIRENVNRAFYPENDREMAELDEIRSIIQHIFREIKTYRPDKVYVLDLHTTSSHGGIFTIVPEDGESITIGKALGAPVITQLTRGIAGTTMQYFTTENLGVPTVCFTFESGQHDDPLSVNRAIAAITNCMKIIGSIDGRHIENRHNALLVEYSQNLPKLCRLVTKHLIGPDDEFVMKEGYQNFQRVKKGEILGHDRKGVVKSPHNGMILMPLYQKLGGEGFFLVEEIKEKELKS